jgi:MarC family membrane protein
VPIPPDYVMSPLVTLFVVVDPIGLAPTFLAVTHGLPPSAQRNVAVRASAIAAGILIGAALVGHWLLTTLGISLPAFRIAGGLLLFSIASEMVFAVRTERQTRTAEQAMEEHVRNIAVFPLALPLLAGPGAITATVLLAGQADGRPLMLAVLLAVIVGVCGSCVCIFLLATRIGNFLGQTGNAVLQRLLGVLLAAMAVQFVIDGVRAVLAG